MERFASCCSFFVILSFAIWNRHVASSSSNCADLIFLNREIDPFHVISNRNATMMFAVNWSSCSSDIHQLILTVAKKEDNLLSTECKLILNQTACRVSAATTACSCVSDAGPLTFFKNFSRPGNMTYEWTWHYQGSLEKKRAITFVVSGKFRF